MNSESLKNVIKEMYEDNVATFPETKTHIGRFPTRICGHIWGYESILVRFISGGQSKVHRERREQVVSHEVEELLCRTHQGVCGAHKVQSEASG